MGGGTLPEQVSEVIGEPEVDCFIDAVGFEARGHGAVGGQAPATVLDAAMEVTRADGSIGIPGLHVVADPGAADEKARKGSLSLDFGIGEVVKAPSAATVAFIRRG